MKKTLIIASLFVFTGSAMAANTVVDNTTKVELKKEKKEKKKKKSKKKKGCCSAEGSTEAKAACGTGEAKSCCKAKQ